MPLHLPRFSSKDRFHFYSSSKNSQDKNEGSTESEKKDAASTDRPTDLPTNAAVDKDQSLPNIQTLSLATANTEKAEHKTQNDDVDGAETFHTPMTEPGEKPFPSKLDPPQQDVPAANEEDAGKATRNTPFTHPLPGCEPTVRPSLTTDQAAKYSDVYDQVSTWLQTPPKGPSGTNIDALSEDEQMWLTRECLLRYLRATSWNTANAVKRLVDTILWRRSFGIADLPLDTVSKEAETGKLVIMGYDNSARPCVYMNPGRQNTDKSHAQIQHLVYFLERAVEMMDPGQETTALLINFKGATSGGSPSVGQGKQVLNILQSHYPERLGRACISDLPWYINTFFKLISPFIDPVTREKMVFNDDLRKHIPPTQLDKDYGGDVDFVYEHDSYWPALLTECNERRSAYKQRWVEGGKQIGEYENYLRGGKQASLKHQQGDSKEAVPVSSAEDGVQPRIVGE